MINNSWTAWLGLALLGPPLLAGGCGFEPEEQESLQGVVELEETRVGFELLGRITDLQVQEGDVVPAGALLARLDDGLERSSRNVTVGEADVAREQAQAVKAGARREALHSLASRVEAAKATERLLRTQASRSRALLEKGVTAAAAVDDVEGQWARATAEREALEHDLGLLRRGSRAEDVAVADARARTAVTVLELNDARLARHELRAPVAGTVLDVHFERGEVVSAAAPVVTLANTHRPYVDVFVPQAEISAVRVNQMAHVRVDALSHALSGKVEHIARHTEFTPRYLFSERERATLVVRVRVRVEDPNEQLRAGVPAFVRLGAK